MVGHIFLMQAEGFGKTAHKGKLGPPCFPTASQRAAVRSSTSVQ